MVERRRNPHENRRGTVENRKVGDFFKAPQELGFEKGV
jgi:hypothetical protein